jgi:hypothetical protein
VGSSSLKGDGCFCLISPNHLGSGNISLPRILIIKAGVSCTSRYLDVFFLEHFYKLTVFFF